MSREGMDEFAAFYRSVMKPVYSTQYPANMRSDSGASVEQDLYGNEGVVKMADFAQKWLRQNQ